MILLVVLAVIALLTFQPARETQQAQDKADQLDRRRSTRPERATPDADQIVRVLGDDGGAACDEPERGAEPGHPLQPAHERRGRARACGR